MQAAKYIVPSHVSALSRLGSPVDMGAHACDVRTNLECMSVETARLGN
jgi:hypothetical protein